jgi:hypothetical protein
VQVRVAKQHEQLRDVVAGRRTHLTEAVEGLETRRAVTHFEPGGQCAVVVICGERREGALLRGNMGLVGCIGEPSVTSQVAP